MIVDVSFWSLQWMMVGSMAMPGCWPLRRNSQSPCPVGGDSIRDHLTPHSLINGHSLRHRPSSICEWI